MSHPFSSLDQLRKHWLAHLIEAAQQLPPFNEVAQLEEVDTQFWQTLNHLAETDQLNNDDFTAGQAMLCRVVSHFPHLMPSTARDLFWLFGGDCLHFMPDDEIALFQRLDERRYACESDQQPFDYLKEKQSLEKNRTDETLH